MEILLKSIGIVTILYIFYKFFLFKDTFFTFNRAYFILGSILAFLIPIIIIPIYIDVLDALNNFTGMETDFITVESTVTLNNPIGSTNKFNLLFLLKIIYISGVFILGLKFIISLFKLAISLSNHKKRKLDSSYLIETNEDIAPFSFFKWIVYNPNQYDTYELEQIIKHESTHIKQWHFVDMILVNILLILQWFNPFIYLFKKSMEQNLEFIADQSVINSQSQNSGYDILLLKTALPKHQLQYVNNFFSSPIKNRINMLHSKHSKSIRKWKYLLLIPILSIFLYSFSTEKRIYTLSHPDGIITISSNKAFSNLNVFFIDIDTIPQKKRAIFLSPIDNSEITSISGFGNRIHPIYKIEKFHKGIDLRAKEGVDIVAVESGVVIFSGFDKANGNHISIQHKNGFKTNYKHLNSIRVKKGDIVKKGEKIGTVGSTGKSIGPHLHFEIQEVNNNYVNPQDYLIILK
jgi:beta-lactamase regulating signal transducer with metallopeptidase domain